MTGSRRARVGGLLLLVCALRGEGTAPAQPRAWASRGPGLGGEPLSAPAAELRRAERVAAQSGSTGSTWLLDEVVFTVQADGATTTRRRSIVAVDGAGASEWRSFDARWSPWFEDAPTIDARVLDRDGTFHRLDPRDVDLGPTSGWSSPTAGDRRQLRALLPSVTAGAIAEVVLTIREREPVFAAGSVHGHSFGKADHHVATSRVVIDAPAGLQLAVADDLQGRVTVRVEKAAGRIRRIYEASTLAPIPDGQVAGGLAIRPSVSFSTGASWTRVARDYDALVRRQIAAGPLPPDVQVRRGSGRRETIARAAAFMAQSLRFTGLGLAESAVAPVTPGQVWKRRYGDSKDLATFLVALLARAGVEAHVALLDVGPDRELAARLPGLGEIDHAIVHVPGEDLWIEPTELARPGQLPARVEGRLALVAAPSTRGPIRLPSSRAADNTVVQESTVDLTEGGGGSIVEVSRFRGALELTARRGYRIGPAALARYLEGRVGDIFAARLVRHRVTQSEDLSTPFVVEFAADRAGVAYARAEDATFRIDIRPLFHGLPGELIAGDQKAGVPRPRPSALPLRSVTPHVAEWRYTIRVPDGFEATALPASEKTFGPASYSQRFAAKGREVRGHLRFTLSRGRLSPGDVDEIARGVESLMAAPYVWLRFEHVVSRRLERGDLTGALVDARRRMDRAPHDAGRIARFAYVLARVGLTAEAVEVQRRAIQVAPSEPWLHSQLSWVLRRDAVGRANVAGFDRRAAIASMEKAVSLAPDIGFQHDKLGILHSLGDDAIYLGGDLEQAAQSLRRAQELGETGSEELLLDLLLRLGRTGEAGELAGTIADPEHSGAFRLAAAQDDAELAVALANIPEPSRQKATRRFAAACVQSGDYARLRRLLRVAGASLPLDKERRDLLGRLRALPADPTSSGHVVALWLADLMMKDGKRWSARDALEAEAAGVVRWWVPFGSGAPPPPIEGVKRTPQLLADLMHALLEVRSVGRAGQLELLETSMAGRPGTWRQYVSHEGKPSRPRLLPAIIAPQLLAPAVLRAADAARLDEARRILDWAIAEPAAATSLHLTGPQLSRFWTRGQRGDLRRIRLAAAGLLVTLDPDRSLVLLARECPRARGLADACRMARGAALAQQGKHREAEEVVKGLAVAPDASFVGAKARALLDKGAWPELERLAAARLTDGARLDVESAQAWSWIARGRPERARAIADSIRSDQAGKSVRWRNFAAWMVLFTGGDLGPAVAELEAAIAATRQPGWAALHTLAVCYARAGRHREALDTIRRAAGVRGRAAPIDQLVLGRIAASAGLTAAARRAYRAVIADTSERDTVGSSAALARRWMAELPR